MKSTCIGAALFPHPPIMLPEIGQDELDKIKATVQAVSHVHHGDAETFYILSGEGEFNDNGTVRIIKKGDVTYTPSNVGHSLINKGSANLVLMALIIYD